MSTIDSLTINLPQALTILHALSGKNSKAFMKHPFAVLARRTEEKSDQSVAERVLEQKLAHALDTLATFLPTSATIDTPCAVSVSVSAYKTYIHVATGSSELNTSLAVRLHAIWDALHNLASEYTQSGGPGSVARGDAKDLAFALFQGQAQRIVDVALEKQNQLDAFIAYVDSCDPPIPNERRENLKVLRELVQASASLQSTVESSYPPNEETLELYKQYSALHSLHKSTLERNIIAWQSKWLFDLQSSFNRERAPVDRFRASELAQRLLEPINGMFAILELVSIPQYRFILEKDFQAVAVNIPDVSGNGPIEIPPEPEIRALLVNSYHKERQRIAELVKNDPDFALRCKVVGDFHEESETVISEYVSHIQTVALAPQTATEIHCECALLHYHYVSDERVLPFPYIGLNKPTCFVCALYAQAYAMYAESNGMDFRGCRMRTNGRDRVVICSVPIGTDGFNAFIDAEMISGVQEVLGAFILEAAARLHRDG